MCGGLIGLPYDVLSAGHFVPGVERHEFGRYRGKELWKEIMNIDEEASVLYIERVTQIFDAKVSKDATSKAKARF